MTPDCLSGMDSYIVYRVEWGVFTIHRKKRTVKNIRRDDGPPRGLVLLLRGQPEQAEFTERRIVMTGEGGCV